MGCPGVAMSERVRCPECRKAVTAEPGRSVVCPACGTRFKATDDVAASRPARGKKKKPADAGRGRILLVAAAGAAVFLLLLACAGGGLALYFRQGNRPNASG